MKFLLGLISGDINVNNLFKITFIYLCTMLSVWEIICGTTVGVNSFLPSCYIYLFSVQVDEVFMLACT